MANTTMGARIRATRKALKWTQKELSEKLGVSATSVYFWESDKAAPDARSTKLLEDRLFARYAKMAKGSPEETKTPEAPKTTPKPAESMQYTLEKTHPFLMSIFHFTRSVEDHKRLVHLLEGAQEHHLTLQQLLSLLKGT